MKRAGYTSQRQLARDLQTNGSVVGKWLSGRTLTIRSQRHQKKLPVLLNTPDDYWKTFPQAAVHVDEQRMREIIREELAPLEQRQALLEAELKRLQPREDAA